MGGTGACGWGHLEDVAEAMGAVARGTWGLWPGGHRGLWPGHLEAVPKGMGGLWPG